MVRREKINWSIYFKINFIHFYALWMQLNYNLYKIQVTQLLLQILVLNFLALSFHFYLIIDVHPVICLTIVSVTIKFQQLAKIIQSNVTAWKPFTSGNRKIDEFRYQQRPFRKTAAKRTAMENVEKERNSNERRERMGGSLQTGLR